MKPKAELLEYSQIPQYLHVSAIEITELMIISIQPNTIEFISIHRDLMN